MILAVNTAVAPHHVALIDREKKIVRLKKVDPGRQSETILKRVDAVFREAGIKAGYLKGLIALTGPGGFTSLRVGITVANTFAHQLKVPIWGIRSEEWEALAKPDRKRWLQIANTREPQTNGYQLLEPVYGREPIITPRKRR